jgi:hypothetical protein
VLGRVDAEAAGDGVVIEHDPQAQLVSEQSAGFGVVRHGATLHPVLHVREINYFTIVNYIARLAA